MVKKIDSNLLYNALYQLLLILVPIITTPFLARVLGPTALGINGYVGAIAAFVGNFMLLGLNQFGVRTIARANKDKLSESFRDLWGTQLFFGFFLVVLYIILSSFLLPYKFFLILELPFLIGYGLDISWFYIGISNVKKVVLRNAIVKICSLVFIFIFIRGRGDLWKYVLINSLGILLANFVFLIDIHKTGVYLKKLNWKKFSFRFFKPLLFLSIPLVAAQLYTNLDSALVGTLAGARQLAFYDQSQKIARILLAMLTSTSTVLMPKMANLDKDNNSDKLMKMFYFSLNITLFVALIFCLLMMINTQVFVPFFFGNSFVVMRKNMYLVSLIVVFISYGSVFSLQFALAKGLYRIYTIPYIVGAIFSLTFNALLDGKFGSLGGTWILVITEFIVCFLRIVLVNQYVSFTNIIHDEWKQVFSFIVVLTLMHYFNFNVYPTVVAMLLNSLVGIGLFLLILLVVKDKIVSRGINLILKK